MRMAAFLLGVAAALIATIAGADGLSVAEIGSFHVGGRAVSLTGLPTREVVFTAGSAPIKVDPNGDFEVEQMYVQYVKLAQPKARYPMLLWHGGGLTGVTWETKPDGKPGWQMFFLRAGHDVYVSDAVERGRASWARYPEIFTTEPLFRTKKQAWEDFRIGPVGSFKLNPAERVALARPALPDRVVRPVHEAGRAALVLDRCPDPGRLQPARPEGLSLRDRRAQPERQLRFQRGPHRAGQGEGADRHRAVGRAQARGGRGGKLKGVPHLVVWGDYVAQSALWTRFVPASKRYADALRAEGGVADWWELPTMGVAGNSHMLMMDKNSDQIAQMIQKWLADRGLMR